MKSINTDKFKGIGAWLLPYTIIVLAFAALFIVITFLISIFVVSATFADSITAAGTLTLAIAAFITIWNINRQEKRRIEDLDNREKRGREENLLNDTSEWLIANTTFRLHFTTWEKRGFTAESLILIESLQNRYVRGVSLARIIKLEWPELAENIDNVTSGIENIMLTLLRDDITTKEQNAISLAIKSKLSVSAAKALSIVDKLKNELLNP